MNRIAVLAVGALAVVALGLVACQSSTGGDTEATEAPVAAETTPMTTEKTLYVGPELVDCTGVAPQQCMQVRETPDGEWLLFYDQIEGFTYEPGFEYELVVSVQQVPNPPADASSLKYTLVEEVSKTPAAGMEGEPSTLEGPTWRLVAMGDMDVASRAMAGGSVTALFADGTVSGSAGCNQYSMGYTVEGDNLSTTPGPVTMMACPEPIMTLEQEYLIAMGAAETYAVTEGMLTIAYHGDQTLKFVAQPTLGLEDPLWNVTGYNNGQQAVTSVVLGTEITMAFARGTVSGSAGCNTYSASYTINGDGLTIGPAATTRKMCPEEGVMEQEQQFLAALETAAMWQAEAGKLELRRADGALAVSAAAGIVSE